MPFVAAVSMLLVGCSDSDNPTPNPPTPDSPDNEEVQPLPTMKSIDLSAKERDAMGKLQAFAFDLNAKALSMTAEVFNGNSGNFCLSPVSASMCLTLVANSVDEPQRSKIVKMFGFDNIDELNTLNTKLMQYLPASENGAKMSLANSVWFSDKHSVATDFTQLMAENFGASVKGLTIPSDEAINTINGWCARHTDNMIPEIIQSMDPETLAIWLNAISFAGAWDNPFKANLTTTEKFNGKDEATNVKMMHRTFIGRYSEKDGISMVSLPFKGESYEMNILTGQANMTNQPLTADLYDGLLHNVCEAEIELALPRFTSNTRADLMPVMQSMGLSLDNMTLTAMGLPENLIAQSTKVIQGASMAINEEGAKIAAVTITSTATSTGNEPEYRHIKFTVDRPFQFVVRNTVTGAIVFMGRINNLPNAE